MVIRRTSQFFFYNLKLGLLKSQKETAGSVADTHEDDVSLAHVLRDALGLAVCSVFVVLSDNTRFLESGSRVSKSASAPCTQFLPQFKYRPLGSVLVMFLRARRWPVGACTFHIQPAKRTLRMTAKVTGRRRSLLLSFYQLQKLSSPCATRWFGLHCLLNSTWTSPLIPTGVSSGSWVRVGKNSQRVWHSRS